MPQREFVPKKYELSKDGNKSTLALRSVGGKQSFDFTFEAVRPNLFRVRFTSDAHPLPPYPSVPEPTKDDSLSSSFTADDASAATEIGGVTATPGRSYVADSGGVSHYSVLDREALHVGRGEKPAPMDLTNRNFSLSASDTFGYDVYRTDPLYKHIPLLIKASSEGVVAIFSSSYSRGTWSVGSELDGLYGAYKVYRQDYGGLEEYF
ncbi:hypothetical protein F66182_12054, partial [Fusarium sp. NRRL 66182]